MDALSPSKTFLFECFRLDRRNGGLFRRSDAGDYVPVSIGSRALEVLNVLVERQGDLVSRDEIMSAVWSGTAVEEANLTVQISTLRRIIDDRREGQARFDPSPGAAIGSFSALRWRRRPESRGWGNRPGGWSGRGVIGVLSSLPVRFLGWCWWRSAVGGF